MKKILDKLHGSRSSSRRRTPIDDKQGSKPTGAAAPVQIPSVNSSSTTPPASDPAVPISNRTTTVSDEVLKIQSETWNDAYDTLKADEPRLVEAYERILSGQLADNVPVTAVQGYPANAIATKTYRDAKLKGLVEQGLARTARRADVKGKINDVLEPFNQLRGVIALAMETNPTAAIAWTGITAAFDVCSTLVAVLSRPLSDDYAYCYPDPRAAVV
jgi:hypothetical protein